MYAFQLHAESYYWYMKLFYKWSCVFPSFTPFGCPKPVFRRTGRYLPVNTVVKTGYRPKPSNPAYNITHADPRLYSDNCFDKMNPVQLNLISFNPSISFQYKSSDIIWHMWFPVYEIVIRLSHRSYFPTEGGGTEAPFVKFSVWDISDCAKLPVISFGITWILDR